MKKINSIGAAGKPRGRHVGKPSHMNLPPTYDGTAIDSAGPDQD